MVVFHITPSITHEIKVLEVGKKNLSNLMTQISNYLKDSPGHDESILGEELYTSNDMTVIRNRIFWKINTAPLFFFPWMQEASIK